MERHIYDMKDKIEDEHKAVGEERVNIEMAKKQYRYQKIEINSNLDFSKQKYLAA